MNPKPGGECYPAKCLCTAIDNSILTSLINPAIINRHADFGHVATPGLQKYGFQRRSALNNIEPV